MLDIKYNVNNESKCHQLSNVGMTTGVNKFSVIFTGSAKEIKQCKN